MTPEATVFIVDDEEGVRDSLQRLIQSVNIRTEAYASAPDFLAAYHPDKWGCLLLDIRMPGMSGLELQQKLATERITLPVLIITGYGDVPSAVRAMKTGAFEFIEKPFNKQTLLEKIQRAIESHQQHRETNAKRINVAERIDTLTPREIEVMRRVVSGQANKVIAFDLGISKKTVEAHRARVMEKMNVRTVAELVRANMLFEEETTENSGDEESQEIK
jgi:two-component system response regulator FixJ